MNRKTLNVLIILLFIFTLAWTARGVYRIISTTAPDFSDLWYSAKDLTANKNPYLNPNLYTGLGYPPNALLFFLPFTLFSYKLSQAVFTLLSFASLFTSVFLSIKIVNKVVPLNYFLLGISLSLLSFPTKFTLGMGQNNAFALLFLLLAFFFYKQKKLALVGFLLGIAIVIKAVFAFILLYFLFKREWKVIFYSIVVLAASVVTVLAISRAETNLFIHYINKEISILLNLSGREIYYNQGLLGFISRLTDNLLARKYLGVAISLILIAFAALMARIKKSNNLTFSLFIIVLLLIDSRSWQHHFLWLIFPFTILTFQALKLKNYRYLALLGISYLLISWNFKNPHIFSSFPINFLLSNTFYGTVMLFFLNILLLLDNKKLKFFRPNQHSKH